MTRKGKGLLGAAGIGLHRNQAEDDIPYLTGETGTTGNLHITEATDLPQNPRNRNASAPILSGQVKMQTVYVTRADQDRATDAAACLKKMRVVRGQIGFSLMVRIGLHLLEKQMKTDERSVIDIACELTRSARKT